MMVSGIYAACWNETGSGTKLHDGIMGFDLMMDRIG